MTAKAARLLRLAPLSNPISNIATISSEMILRSLGLRVFHFLLSFFEESIVDSFPSDAIEEAIEEAVFEALTMCFLP